MTELDAHGLSVDVPNGWEGRIFRRPDASASPTGADAGAEVLSQPAPLGERSYPLVHVASIVLPPDTADFGSDVVEDLGPEDVLVVLKEFDPAAAGSELFARDGMPNPLEPARFSPATLQRSLPDQGGYQEFFHEAGRAFCIYVVLGSLGFRDVVVPTVNEVLGSIRIEPSSGTSG